MPLIRRAWKRIASVHPALYALGIVALVTWEISLTLYVAMVRNLEAQLDREALDGTAFTLLSALIALWASFGIWAGRHKARIRYLVITLTALAGIAFITGLAMLYMAFQGEPFAVPSNVAQLLILVTTALVSIAGTSIGYGEGPGGLEDHGPGPEPYEFPRGDGPGS